ncbi:hypothetical protein ACH4TV_16810 [Streptomyces sp. NPDC020898]|uniref:hypothetical protein n=1 Tax=Streptomyces sp. NPDC020898 TaxID=3365101 RepID=UPI00379835E8
MFSKRRLMLAGLTMVLVAGLGACGGGGNRDDGSTSSSDSSRYDDAGGSDVQETTPVTPTVYGLRSAVRHTPRKTAEETRPHMVKKCRSTTKSKAKAKGSSTTRTCTSVRSGTETYTRVVRQERWCVSLDDVDGVAAKDAVWYQVEKVTYDKAVATDQRARIEFTPKSTGC